MSARVSIMMPAYNAAATLPMALASLAAQSFVDWQAVIVDDGSTDGTGDVARALGDARVEVIRLPTNRGRPYARHAALEAARGQYLCMLDADDWMYPERLARQVAVLDRMANVAVVSAGMAIVDPSGAIVGARCFGERGSAGLSNVYSPPRPPPIAHAPSMLRRDIVGTIRPDPRLSRGQDTDFMMRVLAGHRYYLLPELLYAYAESRSFTRDNALTGHRLNRTIQAKYFGSHPIRARVNWCQSLAKMFGVRLLFGIGQQEYLLRSRSRPPTTEQVSHYEAARRGVLSLLGDAQNTTESPSGNRTAVRSPI
jgi:glycosyltransferase involved in cell wall biosynthesis